MEHLFHKKYRTFCITLFFTGIFIVKDKKLENILINLFYSTIYIFSGSAVLSNFEKVSQWVIFNGNGGFVGEYVKKLTYVFNGLVDEKIIFFLQIFRVFVQMPSSI